MCSLTENEKEILKSAEKIRDYCHERMCENCFLRCVNDYGEIVKCTLTNNIPMHWKLTEYWEIKQI